MCAARDNDKCNGMVVVMSCDGVRRDVMCMSICDVM